MASADERSVKQFCEVILQNLRMCMFFLHLLGALSRAGDVEGQ